MPKQPATFSPIERQAMQAMRRLIYGIGGPQAFATIHQLSVRNVERFAHGHRPPPLGLARTLADMLAREDRLDPAWQKARDDLAAFVADREEQQQHG